jgi:aerobic-type carbon monoxide dehydrogenase small subunit (CoxS/CutS family)
LRRVTLRVNGARHQLELEPRRTLADVIRKELGLTGTKVACDRASCGSCTVLLDGRAVFGGQHLPLRCL